MNVRAILPLVVFAGICLPVAGGPRTASVRPQALAVSVDQTGAADSLFARGRLLEAERAYARRLAADPSDREARARLGLLALWSNRLARADSLLPADDDDARGELLVREKRYGEAARHYRRAGHAGLAAQLEALTDPYHVSLSKPYLILPFAPNTLLPLVHVTVNGREADFLIDTGAGPTIVDPELATVIGARTFGTDSGTYAGGRRAPFEYGVIDSIALGPATVSQVPVHIQGTRAYAAAAGGRTVSGIIGTGLLSQFRPMLDFARHQLELEPRAQPPLQLVGVPFWLLGDHFITVSALAVDSVETLLVLDTGLAMPGGALVPSTGLLTACGVKPSGPMVSGRGGGGRVQVTPFRFPRLRIGPVQRDSILAVAGAFPPTLEQHFGPHLGGLVSHGFFSDQAVLLDFDAMRLYVLQSPDSAAPGAAALSSRQGMGRGTTAIRPSASATSRSAPRAANPTGRARPGSV